MANRYWVGGTATWDATAGSKWATTSGGAGGAAVPTSSDDVFLDAASGAVTITVNTATGSCRNLDCTGFTGTLTLTASLNASPTAGGTVLISTGMSIGGAATLGIISATGANSTLTTNGKTMPSVNFASSTTGGVILAGAFTSSGTVTLTSGTFDTNNQTCSWGAFSSSNALVRTLTLGSSVITMTLGGSSVIPWTMTTSTNLTFNANTSTIKFTGTGTGGAGTVIDVGSVTYNNVELNGAGVTVIRGSATYANLTRTGTAVKTDQVIFGGNSTVTGTLTITGNSAVNRVLAGGGGATGFVPGQTQTITAAAVSLTNVDFQDITGAGVAAPFTGTSLGDALGNTNITTDTPATQTWVGTSGGNWSDVTKWTSRVPLPQDNVVVNAAFSASQTVNMDMPRLGKDISFSGVSGAVRVINAVTLTLYGSLTLSSGIIAATSLQLGFNATFAGRSTHTITSAGISWAGSAGLIIGGPGGTYTLQDDLPNGPTRQTTVGAGSTFTANNFNVSTSAFNATVGATATTVNMGSGTWSLTAITTTNVWNVSGAGLVVNAITSTIAITLTSTNVRTFAGGGLTYGTLTYTVAGSTGGLDITGSNTFNTLNFSDITNARTLRFTAGTTNTFTNFNVNGTSGKLMTISSITAATHTLSKASGIVSDDYLSITNSIATGGAGWYAGANSTDGGGNTGWTFSAAPSGSSGNLMLMGVG